MREIASPALARGRAMPRLSQAPSPTPILGHSPRFRPDTASAAACGRRGIWTARPSWPRWISNRALTSGVIRIMITRSPADPLAAFGERPALRGVPPASSRSGSRAFLRWITFVTRCSRRSPRQGHPAELRRPVAHPRCPPLSSHSARQPGVAARTSGHYRWPGLCW